MSWRECVLCKWEVVLECVRGRVREIVSVRGELMIV